MGILAVANQSLVEETIFQVALHLSPSGFIVNTLEFWRSFRRRVIPGIGAKIMLTFAPFIGKAERP